MWTKAPTMAFAQENVKLHITTFSYVNSLLVMKLC